MPPSNKPEFITTEDGCIVVSNRKLNQDGYYRVNKRVNGKVNHKMYHRVVYEEVHGEIPEGFEVDHICKNRACCNVEHLRAISGEDHAIHTNITRYAERRLRVFQALQNGMSVKDAAREYGYSEGGVYKLRKSFGVC